MKMQKFAPKIVGMLLIMAITAPGMAQQDPHTAKRTLAVARKVASLPPHTKISVIPLDGPEEFGELLSRGPEEFTFRDVDRKVDVTFEYAHVKKIRQGYGGYSHLAGRHVDRKRQLIIVACVVGAIGALLAAAASASN